VFEVHEGGKLWFWPYSGEEMTFVPNKSKKDFDPMLTRLLKTSNYRERAAAKTGNSGMNKTFETNFHQKPGGTATNEL